MFIVNICVSIFTVIYPNKYDKRIYIIITDLTFNSPFHLKNTVVPFLKGHFHQRHHLLSG